jgi:hypothetical protein
MTNVDLWITTDRFAACSATLAPQRHNVGLFKPKMMELVNL